MNPAAKAYWMGLERSNTFIRWFTNGMEGDDWLQRPGGIPSSALWILGHLANSRSYFYLCLTGEETFETGWPELFGMGTEQQDPSKYPTVEEVRAVLDARLADLKAYLEAASLEDIEGPTAIQQPDHETKAHVLSMAIAHEAHHTGALSMIRRLLGKDRLV